MKRAKLIVTVGCTAMACSVAFLTINAVAGGAASSSWGWMQAAVGPFIGAGLAFASNWQMQRLNRRRQDFSAGNLALVTIAEQYNCMLEARRALRHEIRRRAEGLGEDAPQWMYAAAMGGLGSPTSVDFKSLLFIFDKRDGVQVHGYVVLADRHQAALISVWELMSAEVVLLQQEVASFMMAKPEATPDELEAGLRPDKMGRVRDLLFAAIAESESDDVYLSAFSALRTVLAMRFGEDGLPTAIGPLESHARENLPPLPAALLQTPEAPPASAGL